VLSVLTQREIETDWRRQEAVAPRHRPGRPLRGAAQQAVVLGRPNNGSTLFLLFFFVFFCCFFSVFFLCFLKISKFVETEQISYQNKFQMGTNFKSKKFKIGTIFKPEQISNWNKNSNRNKFQI
jgi:hypothetical protein